MSKIDEAAVLWFAGFQFEMCEACGVNHYQHERDGFHYSEPNIYSLDWQKEYLWPKIPDTIWGLEFVSGEYYVKLEDSVLTTADKDPATCVLNAVMEIINKEETNGG